MAFITAAPNTKSCTTAGASPDSWRRGCLSSAISYVSTPIPTQLRHESSRCRSRSNSWVGTRYLDCRPGCCGGEGQTPEATLTVCGRSVLKKENLIIVRGSTPTSSDLRRICRHEELVYKLHAATESQDDSHSPEFFVCTFEASFTAQTVTTKPLTPWPRCSREQTLSVRFRNGSCLQSRSPGRLSQRIHPASFGIAPMLLHLHRRAPISPLR